MKYKKGDIFINELGHTLEILGASFDEEEMVFDWLTNKYSITYTMHNKTLDQFYSNILESTIIFLIQDGGLFPSENGIIKYVKRLDIL